MRTTIFSMKGNNFFATKYKKRKGGGEGRRPFSIHAGRIRERQSIPLQRKLHPEIFNSMADVEEKEGKNPPIAG